VFLFLFLEWSAGFHKKMFVYFINRLDFLVARERRLLSNSICAVNLRMNRDSLISESNNENYILY